ncbi:MAG TPA: MogA/MoaB family molybdenum cofactor biosynthesis protein [Candidatus Acidoferrales bacterium]|nr:MogA/MoaB family molybdenum cofactor biosynthesis protein [Candidatus Acidoferrales bacterium]
MAVEEHKRHAPKSVTCFVVTVSDTRDEATDQSGALIKELLAAARHTIRGYRIVKDEPEEIRGVLRDCFADRELQAIIVNGGTGIAPRDRTYEIVSSLLDKRLDGFGELFRFLSFQEIGSPAMMSRAVGGVARGKVIFSLPGSRAAVELALRRLILPELGHLVQQVQGHESKN